jgi:hypothetical protein
MAEGFCDERLAGCREDTHELFGGFEGGAFRKGDVEVGDLFKIGGERGEMVGVIPSPGRTSLVIVEQDPAESFDIVLYDSMVNQNLRRGGYSLRKSTSLW